MKLFVVYSNTSPEFFLMATEDKKEAIERGKHCGKLGIGFVDAIKVCDLPVPEKPGAGLTHGLTADELKEKKAKK